MIYTRVQQTGQKLWVTLWSSLEKSLLTGQSSAASVHLFMLYSHMMQDIPVVIYVDFCFV